MTSEAMMRLADTRTIWLFWKHCAPQRGDLIARIRATLRFARELRRYEHCRLDSMEHFNARR